MIRRRGRSRDSVTPFGVSLPSPLIVTTVDVPWRSARTRSIVAATAADAGAVSVGTGGATLGVGRAPAAVAAGAFDSRFAATGVTEATGGVVFAATGGITGASAFDATAGGAVPAASSTRMVLRLLLMRYSAARLSAIRTRATPRPSAALVCSSRSAATGPFGSRRVIASAMAALRRSTINVTGSGRFTVYATGSVASITTAGPSAVTLSRRTGSSAAGELPASTASNAARPAIIAAPRRDQKPRICAAAS